MVCPSNLDRAENDVFNQTGVKYLQRHVRVLRRPSWSAHVANPVNACRIKHHNSGLHLYWTKRAIKKIIDGTTKTFSVGEIVDGHTVDSSNRWTYAYRYLDCYRTTNVALNTPPGVDAVTCRPTTVKRQMPTALLPAPIRAADIFFLPTDTSNSSPTTSTSTPIKTIRRLPAHRSNMIWQTTSFARALKTDRAAGAVILMS